MTPDTFAHAVVQANVVVTDAGMIIGTAACACVFAIGWRLLLIGLAVRKHGADFWDKPM